MATREEKIKVTVDGAAKGAADLDRLGRAVDDVGDELKGTAKDATVLDRELDRLQRTSHDLNREFARTGDRGLLKQLKDTRKELAPLQAVRRELDKIAATEEKARRARKQADSDRLKRMLTPSRGGGGPGFSISPPTDAPTLILAALGGAALALPALATAGGAITAAGALGGVGLGVAGAAKNNPAIGKAATSALQDEAKRWQAASKAFEEPTLRAIGHIKAAADAIPLEEMLENSAKFVEPLARGIAGFTEAFGKGLGELIEDAEPVIDVLRSELPRLGQSFESMFDEIGQGSKGGAEALEDILHVTSRLIIGTGKIIHFFEDLYEAGVKLRKALPGDLWSDDTPKIIGYTGAIAGVTATTEEAADATADLNKETETYEDTLHRLLDLPMDLAEANAQYQESLDSLTESIKENGRRWDEGTEAGRKNNEALRDAINDAVAYRDAQIAIGVQSGAANKQLQDQIAKLRAQAVAAGMSAAEFDRLTGALRNYISAPSVKVVQTRFVTEGSAPRSSTPGRQFAFAAGGPASPGPILVGDGGRPEWLWLDQPGYVTQVGQTPPGTRMGSGSGGGSGGGTLRVTGDATSWLYQVIQYGIRTRQIQI